MANTDGTHIYFDRAKGWDEGQKIISKTMIAMGARLKVYEEGNSISLRGLKRDPARCKIPYDLNHELIQEASEIHLVFDRNLKMMSGEVEENTYTFIYLRKFKRWRLDAPENLEIIVVLDGLKKIISGHNVYDYSEALKLYELIKYLHHKLDSQLTAVSMTDSYMAFREDEGEPWGYDSIMRLDRNGQCRLVKPYEERREISKEEYREWPGWRMDSDEPAEIKVSEEFLKLIGELD